MSIEGDVERWAKMDGDAVTWRKPSEKHTGAGHVPDLPRLWGSLELSDTGSGKRFATARFKLG